MLTTKHLITNFTSIEPQSGLCCIAADGLPELLDGQANGGRVGGVLELEGEELTHQAAGRCLKHQSRNYYYTN